MRKTPLALVLLLLAPAFAQAQQSKDSWENLKQLRTGQKVEVVDTKMKTYSGKFASFTDEAITLQQGNSELTVQRAELVRVSVRDTSHRTRNMLLGAAIGGGIALAATIVPLAVNSNEGSSCGACVAAIAAGFGGGTALGMIPGNRTIYRAQSPKGSAAH